MRLIVAAAIMRSDTATEIQRIRSSN